jgi:hypothetical protein
MPDLPGRSGLGLLRDQEGAGLRGPLVITLAGTAFTVANVDERDVVPNLYDKILLIGDKGFISGDVKREAATSTSRRRCARTCRTAVIPAPSPV